MLLDHLLSIQNLRLLNQQSMAPKPLMAALLLTLVAVSAAASVGRELKVQPSDFGAPVMSVPYSGPAGQASGGKMQGRWREDASGRWKMPFPLRRCI